MRKEVSIERDMGIVGELEPLVGPPKFPPVETRILDEELISPEPFLVNEVSGVPLEHIKERTVRVAKASKNAMQSGTENTHEWIVSFDNRQRWENDLMGWASSGDPLSNMKLNFPSKEQAIAYCEKYTYNYYVVDEKPVAPKKKSYASNFSWNKRTRVSTK
ncbi:hypothetical protein V9T40_005248 [Parthenolecanium corni]|uniref:NADH dehydrogenase [ubiquinone] iron-sulfur protein 4, mitochondrial n=1 Tax=Parthenolecanium corni TaxID=536013 RepID=A0AAN9TDU2_9HEMI